MFSLVFLFSSIRKPVYLIFDKIWILRSVEKNTVKSRKTLLIYNSRNCVIGFEVIKYITDLDLKKKDANGA